MTEEIKISKIGKLRIYVKSGESLKAKSLLRKIFPKNKYRQIMQEAKSMGIMNAHVFHTHAAVQKGGEMNDRSVDGETSGLTVCIELVDSKQKLETFYKTHKELIAENTVIYKEVELWGYA